MEGSSSKSKSMCIFPVVAWLLLTSIVPLSATSIQSVKLTGIINTVNGSISWDWGNSTIGSTIADDQEFLMDSQFGNVLGTRGQSRSIVYRVLGPKPFCNGPRYANCIEPGAAGRPCDYTNRCARHI